MGLIKFFLPVIFILSLLNSLARSDFLNIVTPLAISIILYTNFNKDKVGKLNVFLVLIGTTLAYDFIWFVLSSSVILY
jgi:hypothetical protein